jgi:hypothetical protein
MEKRKYMQVNLQSDDMFYQELSQLIELQKPFVADSSLSFDDNLRKMFERKIKLERIEQILKIKREHFLETGEEL